MFCELGLRLRQFHLNKEGKRKKVIDWDQRQQAFLSTIYDNSVSHSAFLSTGIISNRKCTPLYFPFLDWSAVLQKLLLETEMFSILEKLNNELLAQISSSFEKTNIEVQAFASSFSIYIKFLKAFLLSLFSTFNKGKQSLWTAWTRRQERRPWVTEWFTQSSKPLMSSLNTEMRVKALPHQKELISVPTTELVAVSLSLL